MKLTQSMLKQLIKEELETLMDQEDTSAARQYYLDEVEAGHEGAPSKTHPGHEDYETRRGEDKKTGDHGPAYEKDAAAKPSQLAQAGDRAQGAIKTAYAKPVVTQGIEILGAAIDTSGKPGSDMRLNSIAKVMMDLGITPQDIAGLRSRKGSERTAE